jgi:hypothetical protein
MQAAAQAHQASTDSLSGLTFIDILISGATISGLYSIIVSPVYLTPSNMTALISNGYTVIPKYYSMDDPNSGSPPAYIISW